MAVTSSVDERREDRGVGESGSSSLFEVVVRSRRLSMAGIRCERAAVKSATVEVAGRGTERVLGSPSPGNEVRRTLMVEGAMFDCGVALMAALAEREAWNQSFRADCGYELSR